MDGQTILINDLITSNGEFGPMICIDPVICTQELYNDEVTDPVYQKTSRYSGCFYVSGFEFSSNTTTEELVIDEQHINKFIGLAEQTSLVNFYADIEFVERSSWCSAQVNYGLKITLKEGEEDHLLSQFTDSQ